MSRAGRDDGAVNILGYEETEADRRGERDLLRAADRHAAVAHGGVMKAVFDTKPGSGYDDSTERYHFPRSYLRHALACVGDWVILREPQRNRGRRAYVAAARVERIDPDPDRAGHSYAILRDYLPFDVPVPFRSPDGYRELILRAVADPTQVGRALRSASVRPIPGRRMGPVRFPCGAHCARAAGLDARRLDPAGLPPARAAARHEPAGEVGCVELMAPGRLRGCRGVGRRWRMEPGQGRPALPRSRAAADVADARERADAVTLHALRSGVALR